MPLTIQRMEVDLQPEPRASDATPDDERPAVATPCECRRELQLEQERRARRAVD